MLPDFASMIRMRLPDVQDTQIAEGVEFHHHTDRVFHRLKRFRNQESWTLEHMLEHGLRRGPARGVAHVGVELSLDGALVASPAGHDLYRSALQIARDLELDWEGPESAGRFSTLIDRLSSFDVPDGYRDPVIVAERLVRIMEPRPLLRLSEHEAEILRNAIVDVHARVDDESSLLMTELKERL